MLTPMPESHVSPEKNHLDPTTQRLMDHLAHEANVFSCKRENVSRILIIVSRRGMILDGAALEKTVHWAYPAASVAWAESWSKLVRPEPVDLLIDLTAPRDWEGFWDAWRLRRLASWIIGRKAGWLRSWLYDRVFDERAEPGLPAESLERERFVQKKLFSWVGIPFFHAAPPLPDLGKALELSKQ